MKESHRSPNKMQIKAEIDLVTVTSSDEAYKNEANCNFHNFRNKYLPVKENKNKIIL